MLMEQPDHWLEGSRILVAEDEMLIAYDIALTIEAEGGEVAGPVATLARARALLDEGRIDAAVLDMNLLDGSTEPLVDELHARAIPVVVNTAERLPLEFQSRLPEVAVFAKPVLPEQLTHALGAALHA